MTDYSDPAVQMILQGMFPAGEVDAGGITDPAQALYSAQTADYAQQAGEASYTGKGYYDPNTRGWYGIGPLQSADSQNAGKSATLSMIALMLGGGLAGALAPGASTGLTSDAASFTDAPETAVEASQAWAPEATDALGAEAGVPAGSAVTSTLPTASNVADFGVGPGVASGSSGPMANIFQGLFGSGGGSSGGPTAFDWTKLGLNLLGGAYGASQQNSAQRNAMNAARNAQLGNYSLTGPGGMSVGFSPTSGNVALGSLDPLRALLLGNAGNFGNVPGLDALTGSANAASSGMSGLDPAFLQSLQSAAGTQLAAAGKDPNQVAADRLALTRAQAQPYENDFINGSINNIFSRGRFGANDSASGAVGEGITKALTTADQQRQLDATNFAQQQQAQATQNFGNLFSGLNTGLGFNNNTALGRFNIANTLFGGTTTGTNDALTRALGSLSGVQGIDNQGLQSFMAALQAATARSNASNGVSTNFARIGGQDNPYADLFGGLTVGGG